jgi:UDPglucose 6-dehydrogenase
MNILYIGGGFVGACSAAVSANSGHQTLVFDIDKNKVKKLGSGERDAIESCLFEKGLGDLIIRHSDRVAFTTDYSEVESFLETCDAVFMCLPTPEIDETGESNLTYYDAAATQLAEAMINRNGGAQDKYIAVVNKSTVPIEMVSKTKEILASIGVKNFGVVSNPEFLVEGKAVEGALKPSRVVVGADSQKDFDVMRNVYQRFYDDPGIRYIEVNPYEAAAGKLLANFYLFNKLMVCFDVIGRSCETFPELRFEQLRKIIVSDKRIGSWGFYDSLYAGGSCLIKDARSLSHQLQTAGKTASFVDEVYLANKRQLETFMARPETEANIDWSGKKVAMLGVSFKRDTNDLRNAPSINMTKFLLEKGIKSLHVYDPVGIPAFKDLFSDESSIEYFSHEFDAIKNVDAIIIATDWPQFRGIADVIIGEMKDRKPLIVDGRRILQHRYNDLQQAGFSIVAVGSPYIKGAK